MRSSQCFCQQSIACIMMCNNWSGVYIRIVVVMAIDHSILADTLIRDRFIVYVLIHTHAPTHTHIPIIYTKYYIQYSQTKSILSFSAIHFGNSNPTELHERSADGVTIITYSNTHSQIPHPCYTIPIPYV